ncbi:hypothetical protein ACLK1T_00920 [Escherichia coli]
MPVRFIGKNFVFDERMANVYRMRLSRIATVRCACDSHTNCKNDGCHLLFIQGPDARKNTKVVVVRFAAKKARYHQKNSDAVGST